MTLDPNDPFFKHVNDDFGFVYCPKCPNYGGGVKNVNGDTLLSELFCPEGYKEVVEHLKKAGVPIEDDVEETA